jgi:hypothetical protein
MQNQAHPDPALVSGLPIGRLLLWMLLGEWAMQVMTQLLATAVLMPVLTGAMYFAWKQMFAGGGTIAASALGGFEA